MHSARRLLARHRRRLLLGGLITSLALAPVIGEATGLVNPCRDGLCRISTWPAQTAALPPAP